MNTEDDFYNGDMSDDEYRQRIRREAESERYYAREAELYKQRRAAEKVYYPKVNDDYEDSGSMW
jgi:hypothetical protein